MLIYRYPSVFLGLLIFSLQSSLLSSQYSLENKKVFTLDEGLYSNTCYNTVQDKDGYIWISSEGGLVRYNGSEFKRYGSEYGLSGVEVAYTKIDNYDRIWLNISGDLTYLKNDSLHTVTNFKNPNLNWNFDIHNSTNGDLWITYRNNLLLFDGETLVEKPLEYQDDPQLKKKFLGENNDTTWILIETTVTKFYKGKTIDSFKLPSEISSKYDVRRKASLFYPFLAISTNAGIFSYDLNTKKSKLLYPFTDYISKFYKKDKKLWAISHKELLYIELDKDFNYLSHTILLEDDIYSDFNFDNDDNLWVCTNKNGIHFFPKVNDNISNRTFENASNYLETVLYSDNKLFIGTNKMELIEMDKELEVTKIPFTKKIGVNRIVDMVKVQDDHYILSTDLGLVNYENGKSRILFLSSTKQLSLKGNDLYTGNFGRSIKFKLDNLLEYKGDVIDDNLVVNNNVAEILFNERCYSILHDSQDRLWVANVNSGLTKIENTDTIYYSEKSNLFSSTINVLQEYKDGIICAATNGEGLLIIKDDEFFQISHEQGLVNPTCNDLLISDDSIFLSAKDGLYIISDLEFETQSYTLSKYGKENGLPSKQINSIAKNGNTIYLATDKGLSIIDMSKENTKKTERKIFIEDVLVNNDPVEYKTYKLDLENYENNILIRYNSPEYINPENITFKYKLSKIDDDWITTTSNETHYSNLPHGEYTFSVTTAEEQNFQSLTFRIAPLMTQSFWFKFLMVLLGLTILYSLLRYIITLKQKEQLLRIVDFQKKQLAEQVNDLNDVNQKLKNSNKEIEQFAYIASHDLQEPLNTITGFTDLLKKRIDTQSGNDIDFFLNTISNSTSRMKQLVSEILTYSRIGTVKEIKLVNLNEVIKNIEADLYARIQSTGTRIDYALPSISGYETELRLLFQNLISNAIKFQKPDTHPIIKMNYEMQEDEYLFKVEDNGIGIEKGKRHQIFNIFSRLHKKSEYAGTGIGLSHCKKIIDLHKGRIWVESDLGEGSTFMFTISKNL